MWTWSELSNTYQGEFNLYKDNMNTYVADMLTMLNFNIPYSELFSTI
jgi:hypothetical protein